MSRAAAGDTVVVKPANNVYTVLVIAATVASIMGLVAVVIMSGTLVDGLFS